jgi:hypothetical protein
MDNDGEGLKGRRWWVIGGGVLLGLVVLTAVFSLGVYVGRRGWGAGAPAVVGPAQRPQGQGQLPTAQVRPQARPALQGRIRAITPDGIAVNTADGPRFVRVTQETAYTRATENGEAEIDAAVLQLGQPVAVYGRLDPDTRTLTAERIVQLPAR